MTTQNRSLRTEPWIHTRSGRAVSLINPQPEDMDALDIAFSLAGLARYTGHAYSFVSSNRWVVGQHCIVGSIMAEVFHGGADLARNFLMHDAVEAYVGDVSSPLKRAVPGFKVVEARFHDCIDTAFGVQTTGDAVTAVDLAMLASERRLFMPEGEDWGLTVPEFSLEEWRAVGGDPDVWDELWTPWPHDLVERRYLARMEYLHL